MIARSAPALAGARRSPVRRLALLAIAGVALISLLVGAATGMVLSFRGNFSSDAQITATLPSNQPVGLGAEVTYRQVDVGSVAGQAKLTPAGTSQVRLKVSRSELRRIPGNVQVQVAPSSVFGVQTIVLTVPAHPTGRLADGVTLPAASGGSASVQGSLQDLDHVLTGLHPAQIDETLGTLAQTFQGQGPALGGALDQLTTYLGQLIPHLPALNNDLDAVTPTLQGLSAAVPDLLATAGQSATVAQTLVDAQQSLVGLLNNGQAVSSETTKVFNAINGALHAFLTNFFPLLIDVQANPNVIPVTLQNLDNLAKALFPALEAGPWLQTRVNIVLPNDEDALFGGTGLLPDSVAASEAHDAAGNLIDPPTYTAANCPRYDHDVSQSCAADTAQTSQAPDAPTAATAAQMAPSGVGAVSAQLLGQLGTSDRGAAGPAVNGMLATLLVSLVPR